MKNKLKVLYVTGALTAPPHIGCMIRTLNICRQIEPCADITMLGVSPRLNEDSVHLCRKKFDRFYTVDIKRYSDSPSLRGKFLHKWYMHWPTSRGQQANSSDQELFQSLVKSHDLVWFHTLYAANPFRFNQEIPSVMDLDDLHHCKYQLEAFYQTNARIKISKKVQAFRWKMAEFNALKKYSRVLVCSDDDRECLGSQKQICVIPNGFTRPNQEPVWKTPNTLHVGFIGSLDYYPNHDGLIWFRDNVWPLIRKQKPAIRLRIIGSPPTLQKRIEAEGFEYLGFLEDPTEEMQNWSSLIVPLLYGGGTRIKIIDAFSKKCPVVSTSIGAHGIQVTHEKNILLADNPVEFAQSCLNLSNEPQVGEHLAEDGWKLFVSKYSWDVIGQSIREIIHNLTKKL